MSIDVQGLNQLENPAHYSTAEGDPTLHSLQRSRTRRQPGEWEELYFQFLCEGKTREVAAALAGVTRQAPFLRRKSDVYFAEMEYASVQMGTADLLNDARDVIKERARGYERVLIHLLSHRGVNAKTIVETSGPNGGPQQVNVTGGVGGVGAFDIDAIPMPIDVKRAVVARMEEIEAMIAPYRGNMNGPKPNVGQLATGDRGNGVSILGGVRGDAMDRQEKVINVAQAQVTAQSRPRPLVRLPI